MESCNILNAPISSQYTNISDNSLLCIFYVYSKRETVW
jgi:hypothetical protein